MVDTPHFHCILPILEVNEYLEDILCFCSNAVVQLLIMLQKVTLAMVNILSVHSIMFLVTQALSTSSLKE